MRVYVESNFVLELTLAQRQHRSCEEIIELCSSGSHELLIPAFCLPESHHALVGKLNSRNRVRQDLLTQRNQLLRTSYHSNLVSSLDDVNILLSQSADAEIERLRAAIEKITRVATLIPLDEEVVETAAGLHGDGRIERYFDHIVLASVLIEARRSNLEASCFLNTDREFLSPEIVASLENVGCKILPSFDDGLKYLTSQSP